MKTSELFRKTLKEYLDKQGHGAQADLADDLGIDRSYLNGFLSGRKMLSESKREQIAEKLGYSYIDFLILGRSMFTKKPDKKEIPMPEADLSLILLGQSIEHFEKFITTILGKNLKLTSEIKAKVIVSVYDILSKNTENTFKYKSQSIDISTLIEVIETFDDLDKKSIALFGEDDIYYKWTLQGRPFMMASCCNNPKDLEIIKDTIKNLDKESIESNIIDITELLKSRLKRAA